MTKAELADVYRSYIASLNLQDWSQLGQCVYDDAIHNGCRFGLWGAMLVEDFDKISDLRFNIALPVADPPHVAARLDFDCTPKGIMPVHSREWQESFLCRECDL